MKTKLTIALISSLIATSTMAVEIVDPSLAPRGYAQLVPGVDENGNPLLDEEGNPIVDEDGNPVDIIEYGTSARLWGAGHIHYIMAAYGRDFDFENFESVNYYATAQEVMNEEEEVVNVLNFESGAKAWRPAVLDTILTAYGLTFDYENNPEGLRGFAGVQEVPDEESEEEGATKSELVFVNEAKAWTAGRFNQVLSAYIPNS